MKRVFQSHAKLNLALYIISRREDGYHNLLSLMTPISLCDDVMIEFDRPGIAVACSHPQVPEGRENLVWKAAGLFYSRLGQNPDRGGKGISIKIDKKIPPGGGLGGGSSNAALVLTVLNSRFENPFSESELMDMGLSIGADVPFFILGGPAMVSGVGEKLEKLSGLPPCHVVLCDPGVAASTSRVYKNIDFELTFKRKYNISNGLNVPLPGEVCDMGVRWHNDLEEPACRLYPRIGHIKEEMELLLGRKVLMSGSGSSLFALFSNRENALEGVERLEKQWAGKGRNVFFSSFGKDPAC